MTASKITLALQVMQGLLTPLIAVIAVYIAWQQWKANERKLVIDRYDRRLRVYTEVVAILNLVIGDLKPQIADLMKFRVAASEADFLFGPDIPLYIQEIYSRGLKLWRANTDYRDYTQVPPAGYDPQRVTNEMHEQGVWFTEQYEVAKDKFKKYLDISK